MTLKYLAVGTGRDGTRSLTHITNEIFRLNGISALAAHEFLSVDCYNAYCFFKETGDENYLDELRIKLANCPYEAVIGNGYAPLLGIIRALFPDVALIHLRRHDREANIASLARNSRLFPETYIYYGAADGIMKRVTSFHENEMSPQAWHSLSLNEKFGWYYDYTHAAIDKEKTNFSRCLNVSTETLSEKTTLEKLSQYIVRFAEAKIPEAVHLNRHSYLNVDDFNEDARQYAHWLFHTLSAGQIARDTVYLSEYVTNKYIALAGYQITGFIKEFAPAYAFGSLELSHSLDKFEALLLQKLKETRLLKAELDRKIGKLDH